MDTLGGSAFSQQLFYDGLIGLSLVVVFSYCVVLIARRSSIPVFASLFSLGAVCLTGILLSVPQSPWFVGGDGILYLEWAKDLHAAWISKTDYTDRAVWPGKGVWPTVLAAFFLVTGPSVAVPITLSAFIVALSVLVLQITLRMLISRPSQIVILFVVFSSPANILNFSTMLREPIQVLGVALGGLAIVSLSKKKFKEFLLTFPISAFVLMGIRPDLGLALVWAFTSLALLTWVVVPVGLPSRRVRAAISALTFVALVFSFSPLLALVNEQDFTEEVETTFSQLSRPSVDSRFAGPAEESAQNTPNQCEATLVPSLVCQSILNSDRGLAGPRAGEMVENPNLRAYVILSVLHFQTLLVFALFFAVMRPQSRWLSGSFIALAIGLTLAFSGIMGNYGALIRFRLISEVILLPFAIGGLDNLLENLRNRPTARFTMRPKKSSSASKNADR